MYATDGRDVSHPLRLCRSRCHARRRRRSLGRSTDRSPTGDIGDRCVHRWWERRCNAGGGEHHDNGGPIQVSIALQEGRLNTNKDTRSKQRREPAGRGTASPPSHPSARAGRLAPASTPRTNNFPSSRSRDGDGEALPGFVVQGFCLPEVERGSGTETRPLRSTNQGGPAGDGYEMRRPSTPRNRLNDCFPRNQRPRRGALGGGRLIDQQRDAPTVLDVHIHDRTQEVPCRSQYSTATCSSPTTVTS